VASSSGLLPPVEHRRAGSVDIVLGVQWGDEGKGRVVDLLARDYAIVARFGGGDNAGHSIEVGEQKLALRIVPSGALVPSAKLHIGAGTVVSLGSLIAELDSLAGIGVDVSRITISDRAQIVFPFHAALDRAAERARGGAAIGTTGRGIGPAYIDRVGRTGVTFGDLRSPATLADKIRLSMAAKAPLLAGVPDVPSADDVFAEAQAAAARIVPHVVDGVAYINEALERGDDILAEGAQGTLLDVTFGSYPYVTSSSTIAGGACVGLGIGPGAVRSVTGVAKAYCTRVGGGPFPSELPDDEADRLRQAGGEFGVVTGRPRRTGWFDAVATRYAARVNGLDRMIVTKLDVLSGFQRVGIVTGYRHSDGSPAGVEAMGEPGLKADIEYHPGWTESLRDVRHVKNLPRDARAYLDRLANITGVPVALVSVGPERTAFAAC
jgi:adenylosuccinate synthase